MLATASAQRFLCQPLMRLKRLGGLDSRVRILRRLFAKQCWVIARNILRSVPEALTAGCRVTNREFTRGEGLNECGETLVSISTSKSSHSDRPKGLRAESSLLMDILSANSFCSRRTTEVKGWVA